MSNEQGITEAVRVRGGSQGITQAVRVRVGNRCDTGMAMLSLSLPTHAIHLCPYSSTSTLVKVELERERRLLAEKAANADRAAVMKAVPQPYP